MNHAASPLVPVLLTLTTVIALGWVLGRVFRWLGQPPVIGEVVAGIALGPSLLGRISPDAMEFMLPASAAPYLGVIAQLGVILYMFVIGLELNLGELKSHSRAMFAISATSIVVPFALGAVLAIFLYPRVSSAEVPFTTFTLFLGVAMSITAFPVLARILSDLRMQKTPLGMLALGCAAIDDATAWCLLALAAGAAKAEMDDFVVIAVLALAYVVVMLLIVRPMASRLLPRDKNGRGATVLLFVALLLSALATEMIGIHAIFGAFLLGAVVPHDSAAARDLTHKLEDVVTILLLPAFFAFTGLRTQIGLVDGWEAWLFCGLIILVATVGKFGGAALSARAVGVCGRDATALGILMNTRGLMELIVLNVGLDLKIISPQLFAMMVLMALVTTLATTPLLRLFHDPAPSDQVDQHS